MKYRALDAFATAIGGRNAAAPVNITRRVCMIAGTLLMAAAVTVSAKEQTANVNTSVAAGESQITRLRDLPEGATVSIAVDIDGPATVMLLDEQNLDRSRANRKPLFSGETRDRISLAARIPTAGNYYLLVDNEDGTEPRHFAIAVTARSASANDDSGNRAKLSRINGQLDAFKQNLRRYFVFDHLNFKIARCGTANAFSTENTVIICAEIGPKLREVMGDDAKALAALHFAMMHEIGHVLLQQWGYPFHDNEEVADEFATALLVLFRQSERARIQAAYFSKIPPEKEFALKRSRDDRHPLSVQRARNILGWLDDPALLRRWQTIFVPHLQTDVLQAMQSSTKPWVDHAVVARELELRSN